MAGSRWQRAVQRMVGGLVGWCTRQKQWRSEILRETGRSSTELKATVRFRCQVPSQRRAEEWREDSSLCFVLDAAVAGVSVSSLRSPPGTRYLGVLRSPFCGPHRELRSLTGVGAVRQPQLLTQRLLL